MRARIGQAVDAITYSNAGPRPFFWGVRFEIVRQEALSEIKSAARKSASGLGRVKTAPDA